MKLHIKTKTKAGLILYAWVKGKFDFTVRYYNLINDYQRY